MRRQRHSAPQGGVPLLSELLEHVMGLMHPRDVARAAAVSREWGAVSRAAMAPSLCRLFGPPRAAKLIASLGPAGAVARLEARAAEEAALPAAAGDADVVQPQGIVSPAVRAVAAEWLIEVCWDWKLESTTVFMGVRYLDLWLATTRVEQLSRFQGVAVSCLRAAFQASRDARGRKDLAKPSAWADVCDGAASAGDVSAACRVLARLLKGRGGAAAGGAGGESSKLALRRLWYQMLEAGLMTAGRVYVYMLASFLLHLSLLDAPLSRGAAPTLVATGALALALDTYGFDPWPPCLEARSPLLRSEVEGVMARLREAQAKMPAKQLRLLWSTGYNYEATHEWLFLRHLVSAPADAGGLALERGAGRRALDAGVLAAAAAMDEDEAPAAAGGGGAAQAPPPAAQQPAAAAAGPHQGGGDDDEVEQPAAGFGGGDAAQPAAQQGGEGEEASNQAVEAVVEEAGEMDDSGTSPAAAPAPAAAAAAPAERAGGRRRRQAAPAAAPARQLPQRRARRGGVAQAVSQSGSAASVEGGAAAGAAAAAAAPPATPMGAAASQQLPFATAEEAAGAGGAFGTPRGPAAATPAAAVGMQPQQRRFPARDDTPGLALAHPAGGAAAGGAALQGAGGASEMGMWQL
ncbi:MAG: hypothetical protein J3K34DRAFT_523066 [Monoraphidium minutum]|nr:MAG: hypothetical protein J3K34DRAFT_523066 [Monoraphidium minutum]